MSDQNLRLLVNLGLFIGTLLLIYAALRANGVIQ